MTKKITHEEVFKRWSFELEQWHQSEDFEALRQEVALLREQQKKQNNKVIYLHKYHC